MVDGEERERVRRKSTVGVTERGSLRDEERGDTVSPVVLTGDPEDKGKRGYGLERSYRSRRSWWSRGLVGIVGDPFSCTLGDPSFRQRVKLSFEYLVKPLILRGGTIV